MPRPKRPWSDLEPLVKAVIHARCAHSRSDKAYQALIKRPQWKHISKEIWADILARPETKNWISRVSGGKQDLASGYDGELSAIARETLVKAMRNGDDDKTRVTAALGVLVHERWRAEQRRKLREQQLLEIKAAKIEAAIENLEKHK